MIELDIPKDIFQIKTKFIGGFSFREFVSILLMAIIGLPLFFTLRNIFVKNFCVLVVAVVCSPIGLWGFAHPYNMTFEKFLKEVWISKIIAPRKRAYVVEGVVFTDDFMMEIDYESRINNQYAEIEEDVSKDNSKKKEKLEKRQVSSDPDLFCCF